MNNNSVLHDNASSSSSRGSHYEEHGGYYYDYEFLHRMNGLRQAYFRHLSASSHNSSNWNKHNDDPRFADQVQYVALHHFHPRVVREVAEASGLGLTSVDANSSAN